MSKHSSSWRWPAGLGLVGLLVCLGLGAAAWEGWQRGLHRESRNNKLAQSLPRANTAQGYVSSDRCQSCHPGAHASWHQTFHRTMTQAATPENIIGRFDGTIIWSDGLAYRVFRKGEEYWAEMPDPDELMYVIQGGKPLALADIPRVERPVVMATGSHHYQTYWVASAKHSRVLQTLPLVYLIAEDRWIPREEAFLYAPHDRQRMVTQWNHHCIRCHSTGGHPGLTPEGELDTRVGELGIACESCHGPAEEHVRQHRDPLQRYAQYFSGDLDHTIVNPARLNHRRSSEVCGQCHGVFVMREEFAMEYAREGTQYRPGEDLHRTHYLIQHPANDPDPERQADMDRNPDFFRESWWDDGTILVGGREYTAMSVSACFTRGQMSCLSCHSMHDSDPVDQLRRGLADNASCTQCHTGPQYTSNLSAHTFHAPESSGSNCLNCHMPHTTYALLKGIRSHQIVSPSLAGSVAHGVPNACNLCHLDQPLAWTQEHLADWYGQPPLRLSTDHHETSAALLWLLKGHAAQRVISAWHFGWEPAQQVAGTDWAAPFLAQLLADPYGVVRHVAASQLRRQPGFADFEFDFLADPAELARAVSAAVAHWEQLPPPVRTNATLLLDGSGRLRMEKLGALLEARDDRPVSIQE